MHDTSNRLVDTLYEVETPEGVDLELVAAGLLPRALAWLLDCLIRLAVILLLAIPLGLFGAAGIGVFLIIYFALEWIYPVVFEVLNDGQTPGKRMLGLRVVHDDGTPVTWDSSVLRNLLRAVDILPGYDLVTVFPLPIFYAVGALSALFSSGFKRIGDHAAGTLVVYGERRRRDGSANNKIRPAPPRVSLLVGEQQAVIRYSQRVGRLTAERAAELALLAAPLTEDAGDTARARVDYLRAVAAWLIGRRPEAQ